jgi:hypothetical protein
VVRGLAAEGVTVVATVHSPAAYAFSLFDSLMMLVSFPCTSGAGQIDQTIRGTYHRPPWKWLADMTVLKWQAVLGGALPCCRTFQVSLLTSHFVCIHR